MLHARRKRYSRCVTCIAVLPALLASPVVSAKPDGMKICSGDEVRYILLGEDDPWGVPKDNKKEQACAHLTCPRSRDGTEDATGEKNAD